MNISRRTLFGATAGLLTIPFVKLPPVPVVAAPVKPAYSPVLISLIRRNSPKVMAYDICGVQMMTGPTGQIFTMRTFKPTRYEKFKKSLKYHFKEMFTV